PLNTLSLHDALTILKATSTYNPVRNPERALERRNVVLAQMKKYNYLNDTAYNKAVQSPISLELGKESTSNEGDSYLRAAVAKWLEKWCEDNGYDLYEDGLRIYTTIDSRLQKHAEEAVAEQMKILQRRFYNSWGNEIPWRDSEGNIIENFIEINLQRLPWYEGLKKKYANQPDSLDYYLNKPKKMTVFDWDGDKEVEFSTIDSIEYYAKILNTGMMTLDPFTGKIKVWIGGDNYNYFKYDHVKQAKRQAGSTFKPFAYLAAIESGIDPCDKYI